MNKYDNINIHCYLQITGPELKQEYIYSSSPETEYILFQTFNKTAK